MAMGSATGLHREIKKRFLHDNRGKSARIWNVFHSEYGVFKS